MRYLFRAGIIILVFINSGCIKDPIHIDIWPIKANPGKFECYINGRDFVPDSGRLHLFGGPITTYVQNSNNGLYDIIIEAHINGYGIRENQEVSLYIQNVSGTGVYEFNDPNYQHAEYTRYPILDSITVAQQIQPTIYSAPASGHGSLTLTRFDVKNQVIAGTFWFNAVNAKNAADSVKITSGHFNIADATFR
jgi:hypothetical protein